MLYILIFEAKTRKKGLKWGSLKFGFDFTQRNSGKTMT